MQVWSSKELGEDICGHQRNIIGMHNHGKLTQGESLGRKRQEYCSSRIEGIYTLAKTE
jgi:hypothetical protein